MVRFRIHQSVWPLVFGWTMAAPVAAVVLDFDDLAAGEVVDDDYPEATFSSPDGRIEVIPLSFAPSPPHSICTVPGGGSTCISDVRVAFTLPVDGLSLRAVGAKNAGVVARVEVFSGSAAVAVVDVVSPGGDGRAPILVDLTAFTAVDEILIYEVDDPAGLAFDDFVFTPDPMPLFSDGFEAGDLSRWSGFSVPPDALVRVSAPATIADDYPAAAAAFGLPLDVTGVNSDLEYVDDGVGTVSDACEPLLTFTPGRIALIDQGLCGFGTQVLNVENAGAVGAVVVSASGDALVAMEPGIDGGAVIIPSVFLGQSDGDLIKSELGVPINVTLQPLLPALGEELR